MNIAMKDPSLENWFAILIAGKLVPKVREKTFQSCTLNYEMSLETSMPKNSKDFCFL